MSIKTKQVPLLIIIREILLYFFSEDSYVKCKWPTPPVHGYIVGPVSVDTGSIIHIACNHSYHLIGANTMQCQAVPNPFKHMALWFHQVGDMSYSDQPKCISKSIQIIGDGTCM